MSIPIRGCAWHPRSPVIAVRSVPTPCRAVTKTSTRLICWCWSVPTRRGAIRFLVLKPGTDTALFSGLLVQLADDGALDHDYIERHTSGFEDALARARSIAGSV